MMKQIIVRTVTHKFGQFFQMKILYFETRIPDLKLRMIAMQ